MAIPRYIRPLSLPTLDEIRSKDTELYTSLKALQEAHNDVVAQLNLTNLTKKNPPTGPQNVAAAQFDGTIQITWNEEIAGSAPKEYQVWIASAGTRNAPTSPTWGSATRLQKVPSNNENYYPIGSQYQWQDKQFSVTDKDPANPSRKTYWVTTLDQYGNESIPIQATGSPIEVPLNGPGDNPPAVVDVGINKLYNAHFLNNATTVNVNIPGVSNFLSITAATNATPIAITTSVAHGMLTGDTCLIDLNTGNTAANGWWIITKTGANTFTLNGSVGNGALGVTGEAFPLKGQPQPTPGTQDPNFNYPWEGGWFDNSSGGSTQWVSDGTQSTQEVLLSGGAGAISSEIQQNISVNLFRQGMKLVFSVYAKRTGATDGESLRLQIVAGVSSFQGIFSGANLTTSYQRCVFTLQLGSYIPSGYGVSVDIINFVPVGHTGSGILVTKPMINVGNIATAWTATTDSFLTAGALQTGDPAVDTFARTPQQIIVRDASAPYV
jgi:hypothetical protein